MNPELIANDAAQEVPNQDYEFRPPGDDVRQMEVLQTDYWEARSPPHKKWDDECTDESHGTKVASKAVGTQFGVAKSVSAFETTSKPMLVSSNWVLSWSSPVAITHHKPK